LDDVRGLQSESGAASQYNQEGTVTLIELWSFHLSVEDNQLLTEHRIFNNQISPAAVDI
jgi:hypothetical protein